MDPKRTTYLCAFPRFPNSRSRESVHHLSPLPSAYSTPRTLPLFPYPGPDLRQRILPIKPLNLPRRANKSNTTPTSPEKKHPRAVFSSATKPRPLRLVQESLNRKRRPPVFFAQSGHSVVQSVTCITIHQKSPPPSSMASNPAMPKVAPMPSLPSGPRLDSMSPPQNKDQLLADLRRQVNNPAFPPLFFVVSCSEGGTAPKVVSLFF